MRQSDTTSGGVRGWICPLSDLRTREYIGAVVEIFAEAVAEITGSLGIILRLRSGFDRVCA